MLNERQGAVFKGNLACQVGQPTWGRGNSERVAKRGVVPDVLVYTWKMSTFFTLVGDLEVLCPKIYKAKRDFPSAGHSGKGDFLGDQEMLLLSGHPFLAKGGERAQPAAQMHTPSCEIPAALV